MAADEAQATRPRFDFANPRRPAPPPNRRRQAVLGAFAATVVGGAVWLAALSRLNGLDDEIATLRTKSAALEAPVKSAAQIAKQVADLERWQASDVLWLAEFERLSKLAPTAEKLQLTQLRFAAEPQGGEAQMSGIVSDADVVDELERALRDSQHAIEGKGRQHDSQSNKYPWRFKSDVVVKSALPKPTGTSPAKGGR